MARFDGSVKAWRCRKGGVGNHVLGQVFRDGNGTRKLALYRNAVDPEAEGAEMAEVEVMAVVDGFVADIKCSICGCVRTWVPGEESLRQLIERTGRKYVGE